MWRPGAAAEAARRRRRGASCIAGGERRAGEITYERDQKQFKLQAVSQATVDTDAANLKNAHAQVAQQQAIVEKKTLRAPFAGHLGIRAVDLGSISVPDGV